MSQFRLARLAMMVAALGLNAAPVLMHSASAADEKAAQADSVRPELFKLLDPAQIKPLMDAKNYTELQNRITQADAIANKTPYENFVLSRTKLSLAAATKNEQLQIAGIEGVLASGKLPAADVPKYTKALADTYYTSKNYTKAAELYNQVLSTGYETDNTTTGLVRSYYFSKDYAKTVAALGPQLDAQVKAGKTPSQEDLKLYRSAASQVKDNAALLRSLELFTTYYPNDEYWEDLVSRGIVQRPGFSDANIADVLRLQFAASKQLPPEAYVDLAGQALQDGFPTEAKKVADAGFAAGVLNTAAHKQLRDKATKQAADDAKSIANGEAAAAKAKTGAGLVNTGWAYVTMDQFDKGIPLIEQGIAKGGLKSPDTAKLRLGMAYARAGQKDKAIQTFETVKAGGGLADTAKYWILLLNHPNTGGAVK